MILLGEAHDVISHGLVVALDQILLIEQGGGTVADGMEQVGTGPVKDRHEVVADGLDTELGQVADALLVVLDVLVAGGQTDLDVIVNVDRLNDGSIEAVRMDLIDDGLDLVLFPDLTGHLAVQGPDDLLNTGICLMSASVMGSLPSPYQRQPIFIDIGRLLYFLIIASYVGPLCEGGPRSGWERDYADRNSVSTVSPQSASLTAPSQRKPFSEN